MPYAAPQLTLIGQAAGVVFGGKSEGMAPDPSAVFTDPILTSDTEW